MAGLKPMLADKAKPDLSLIKFPVLVSVKLDGIRCLIIDRAPFSRTLKLIPNLFVQEWFRTHSDYLHGLDGELICGDPDKPDTWNKTSSGVMSKDGEPDFFFHVFDDFTDPGLPYQERLASATRRCHNQSRLVIVPHVLVSDPVVLQGLRDEYLHQGFEGAMVRSIDGVYKYGRSTAKEGGLLKLKLMDDAEATVIDVKEQMHNTNEAKTNALGRTERSTAKDGLVGKGTLGALICEWEHGTFDIGTGLDDQTRDYLWTNPKTIGSTITFKYQGLTPAKKPRFPSYKGIRHD